MRPAKTMIGCRAAGSGKAGKSRQLGEPRAMGRLPAPPSSNQAIYCDTQTIRPSRVDKPARSPGVLEPRMLRGSLCRNSAIRGRRKPVGEPTGEVRLVVDLDQIRFEVRQHLANAACVAGIGTRWPAKVANGLVGSENSGPRLLGPQSLSGRSGSMAPPRAGRAAPVTGRWRLRIEGRSPRAAATRWPHATARRMSPRSGLGATPDKDFEHRRVSLARGPRQYGMALGFGHAGDAVPRFIAAHQYAKKISGRQSAPRPAGCERRSSDRYRA